jgi:hypothetical protein
LEGRELEPGSGRISTVISRYQGTAIEKTQQAGKDIACAVVICNMWRLAIVL